MHDFHPVFTVDLNLPAPNRIALRFPDKGTTIFTVMSPLAAEFGAIDPAQGFPDFLAGRRCSMR